MFDAMPTLLQTSTTSTNPWFVSKRQTMRVFEISINRIAKARQARGDRARTAAEAAEDAALAKAEADTAVQSRSPPGGDDAPRTRSRTKRANAHAQNRSRKYKVGDHGRAGGGTGRGKSAFLDVHYRPLCDDPLGTVETIYRHFGMELSEQARANMERWIAHVSWSMPVCMRICMVSMLGLPALVSHTHSPQRSRCRCSSVIVESPKQRHVRQDKAQSRMDRLDSRSDRTALRAGGRPSNQLPGYMAKQMTVPGGREEAWGPLMKSAPLCRRSRVTLLTIRTVRRPTSARLQARLPTNCHAHGIAVAVARPASTEGRGCGIVQTHELLSFDLQSCDI